MEIKELLERYRTSEKGLGQREAEERLEHYGYNSLEAKKVTLLHLVIRDFLSPVNLMVVFSSFIFFLVGQKLEGYFALLLFLVNFLITFSQEYKSEKELEELERKVEVDVSVKRDGKWKRIKALYLVPGDIIRVKVGETVPADAVIIEGKNILVDESPVTGESTPKEKGVGDEVYASSILRRGWAVCVVTRTGKDTKYGDVVHLVQTEKTRSNLERLITKLGKFLIITAAFLTPILFFYSYFLYHLPLSDSLIYSLTIFVSFIPAALPAVASSIMLNTSHKLGRKNILIRRLSSVFDIGTMDVLCTDKTGTLTRNEMKLDKVVVLKGSEEKVLLSAYASCDPESGDPIDIEIVRVVKERGMGKELKIVEFVPYDSVRKYSYAYVREGRKRVWVAKGSPEVLIKKLGVKRPDELDKLYEQGYRVLGVARGKEFIGLLAFYDPPLPDAREFIADLKALGISVKMLTGDSLKVAKKIAGEVGIEGPAINREKLEKVSKAHFDFLAGEYNIFAEIFPGDKYMIVSSLKKLGRRVGVTGDGINDIGGIKKADVGIAVFNATNATKSFSDVILTAPGLKQLVTAVKLSRKAIKRLENYVIYRIAEDLRYPFLLFLFFVIYSSPILSPIQVLLLKVLNDIPILSIAFDEVKPFEKPHRIDVTYTIPASAVLGLAGIANSLMFVFLLKLLGIPAPVIGSLLFLKLVLSGHFLLYVVRTREAFWFHDFPSRPLFIPTFATQLIGTLVVLFDLCLKSLVSLLWLIPFTWVYAFLWMNITDYMKVCIFRVRKRPGRDSNPRRGLDRPAC